MSLEETQIKEIYDSINDIKDSLEEQTSILNEQRLFNQKIEICIASLRERVESFNSAFPNSDPARHRFLHEIEMDELKNREMTWQNIKNKFLTAGLWGGFLFICYSSWIYVKTHILH